LTGEGYENGVACFIPVVILLSQRSNGANLTDGIDGLRQELRHICTGIRIFTFLSGNIIFLII
jgi:UDP-N-acetylmuramyl pentapeptide phosphotransferase/UDP-N-acetylglucosamine-1-phosphate transferase